jgi:hypothetical protein
MTSTSPRSTPANVATERALFWDLLAAEWIKLWSLRSTYVALGLGGLILVGFNVQATLSGLDHISNWTAKELSQYNWLHEAFGRAPYMFFMLAAGTLGAITMTGEYSTGQIRTTFTAVPHRRAVVLAKAVVLAAAMTLVGTVVAATSFGVTQAILAQEGGGFSAGDPGVMHGIAGSALIPAMCGLIGMGIGGIVRHPAAAVLSFVAVLLLLPEATKPGPDTPQWIVEINERLPLYTWESLWNAPFKYILDYDPWGTPSLTQTWITFAAWPLVVVAVAMLVVPRQDV